MARTARFTDRDDAGRRLGALLRERAVLAGLVSDGVVPDGPVPNGPAPDERAIDGPVPDGRLPAGPAGGSGPEAAVPGSSERDNRALGRRARDSRAPDGRALVLALPRGGVPVAAQVARVLGAELDIVVARKVGLPWQPELGVGAVTATGPPVFDHVLLRHVGLTEDDLAAAVDAERTEVRRRITRYRGGRPAVRAAGRSVVVVDDGLATGVSARAALREVRDAGPARLVLAVPVAAADRAAWLRANRDADEVVAVRSVDSLGAVGRWYDDFTQLTDDRVVALLHQAWSIAPE